MPADRNGNGNELEKYDGDYLSCLDFISERAGLIYIVSFDVDTEKPIDPIYTIIYTYIPSLQGLRATRPI